MATKFEVFAYPTEETVATFKTEEAAKARVALLESYYGKGSHDYERIEYVAPKRKLSPCYCDSAYHPKGC